MWYISDVICQARTPSWKIFCHAFDIFTSAASPCLCLWRLLQTIVLPLSRCFHGTNMSLLCSLLKQRCQGFWLSLHSSRRLCCDWNSFAKHGNLAVPVTLPGRPIARHPPGSPIPGAEKSRVSDPSTPKRPGITRDPHQKATIPGQIPGRILDAPAPPSQHNRQYRIMRNRQYRIMQHFDVFTQLYLA